MLTRFQPSSLQVDLQIIFGPDNRSIGSITTWAAEKIPRGLGLTCNIGLYRITAEIVKNNGSVGLRYGVISQVKCRRVVVTLTVAVTKVRVYVTVTKIMFHPECLACLTWVICEMGGKWPYRCTFVGCCFQDLFKIARSIFMWFPSSFFFIRFVSVSVVHLYCSTDTDTEEIPIYFT